MVRFDADVLTSNSASYPFFSRWLRNSFLSIPPLIPAQEDSPGIHEAFPRTQPYVLACGSSSWIAGSSPAMTYGEIRRRCPDVEFNLSPVLFEMAAQFVLVHSSAHPRARRFSGHP